MSRSSLFDISSTLPIPTINNIYNGHFIGPQLPKMGSKEYKKVLTTYNKSVKIMYDLSWQAVIM
jgi:hypothetical protein